MTNMIQTGRSVNCLSTKILCNSAISATSISVGLYPLITSLLYTILTMIADEQIREALWKQLIR